jgi:thiamine biosynthesis lipoprotein
MVPELHEIRRVEQVMGMPVTIAVRAGEGRDALVDEVYGWLRWVDARFSTYKPASDISRIARGEITAEAAHPLVRAVLRQAAELAEPTDGYFDLRAGGRLDPSGYVKGWAVQLASDLLLARGAYDHCVNAGGDIRACGTTAVPGSAGMRRPWRIGIQDPWRQDVLRWVVAGDDLAVATSGTYARGSHVLDPHTGRPATELRSVTVIGPDLALADAYATAALAMGERAYAWLAGLAGFESAVIDARGRTWQSAGWPCHDEPIRLLEGVRS